MEQEWIDWISRSNPKSQLAINLATKLHDGGMGYRKIAQWLREGGYKTVRGKRFFANHVYSILKRKRERDVVQNQEVRTEYRNFYLEFIERKLINQV
jgi:hypothetical protein